MSKPKSISIVWKPSAGTPDQKIQGAVEITALKLAAGGGAAVVSIYDSSNLLGCNDNSLRWVLDASTTDVDSQVFCSPLIFTKGVYAICEQGIGFNPILCVAAAKYAV